MSFLRRIILRAAVLVIAGIAIFAAPSVKGCWAEQTSTCTRLLTADDLIALGGQETKLDRAYHGAFFCDASYGYSAFVDLDQDTYHSEQRDEKWLAEEKAGGAAVETLVDGEAWLAVDGKAGHALIVKRAFGAAKVSLRTPDYSADQARRLYPLLKERWGKVDEYFTAE